MFLDERAHFGRVGRAADQKTRPDRCSSFLQRDAVSETSELGDEVPGEAGRVGTALKVVAAELVVLDVVAQHVVGGDQDRVRDGDDRLVVAVAALDALVLRAQVGALAARGGLSGVDQRGGRANGALADPTGSFAG